LSFDSHNPTVCVINEAGIPSGGESQGKVWAEAQPNLIDQRRSVKALA